MFSVCVCVSMVSVPTSAVGERAKWVLELLTDQLSVPECSHFDSAAAKLARKVAFCAGRRASAFLAAWVRYF